MQPRIHHQYGLYDRIIHHHHYHHTNSLSTIDWPNMSFSGYSSNRVSDQAIGRLYGPMARSVIPDNLFEISD